MGRAGGEQSFVFPSLSDILIEFINFREIIYKHNLRLCTSPPGLRLYRFLGLSRRLAALAIRPLVELIELVKYDQNVGYEESKENGFHATLRLVRANAIEQNERKLHLEIELEL